MEDVNTAARMQDISASLTAAALLLSIVRLVHVWVFQARLSRAAISLVKVLPDLAGLAIVSLMFICLLASWGHVLLGSTFEPFSTFSGTVVFLSALLSMAGESSTLSAI